MADHLRDCGHPNCINCTLSRKESAAEQKANALLRSFLNPNQIERLDRLGSITVAPPHGMFHGCMFFINCKRANCGLSLRDKYGCKIKEWCVGPKRADIPPSDWALTLLIHLRHDFQGLMDEAKVI